MCLRTRGRKKDPMVDGKDKKEVREMKIHVLINFLIFFALDLRFFALDCQICLFASNLIIFRASGVFFISFPVFFRRCGSRMLQRFLSEIRVPYLEPRGNKTGRPVKDDGAVASRLNNWLIDETSQRRAQLEKARPITSRRDFSNSTFEHKPNRTRTSPRREYISPPFM